MYKSFEGTGVNQQTHLNDRKIDDPEIGKMG
jgi:hypothetical protein